jgi:hypothetical protein
MNATAVCYGATAMTAIITVALLYRGFNLITPATPMRPVLTHSRIKLP